MKYLQTGSDAECGYTSLVEKLPSRIIVPLPRFLNSAPTDRIPYFSPVDLDGTLQTLPARFDFDCRQNPLARAPMAKAKSLAATAPFQRGEA